MTDQMTDEELKAWFARGSRAGKLLLMLNIMWEFTISLRSASTETDPDFMRRFGWKISEINHGLLSYCSAQIDGGTTYPDEAILGILFDFLDTPEYAPFLGSVWQNAIKSTSDSPPKWPAGESSAVVAR